MCDLDIAVLAGSILLKGVSCWVTSFSACLLNNLLRHKSTSYTSLFQTEIVVCIDMHETHLWD